MNKNKKSMPFINSMVQGEINETAPKDRTTYLDSFKEIVRSSEDVRTFIDITSMSTPRSKEEIKKRASTNIERFKGNYLIISAIFVFIFLIRQLSALFVLVLWISYFVAADYLDEQFTVAGIPLRKEYVLYFCVFLTASYLILFNSIIISLMVTLSLCMIVIVAHMLFYKADDELLEDI